MPRQDITHWIQRPDDVLLDYHLAEEGSEQDAGLSAPAPPLLQWPPGEES